MSTKKVMIKDTDNTDQEIDQGLLEEEGEPGLGHVTETEVEEIDDVGQGPVKDIEDQDHDQETEKVTGKEEKKNEIDERKAYQLSNMNILVFVQQLCGWVI